MLFLWLINHKDYTQRYNHKEIFLFKHERNSNQKCQIMKAEVLVWFCHRQQQKTSVNEVVYQSTKHWWTQKDWVMNTGQRKIMRFIGNMGATWDIIYTQGPYNRLYYLHLESGFLLVFVVVCFFCCLLVIFFFLMLVLAWKKKVLRVHFH